MSHSPTIASSPSALIASQCMQASLSYDCASRMVRSKIAQATLLGSSKITQHPSRNSHRLSMTWRR